MTRENLNSFSCLGTLNLTFWLNIGASSAAPATMQSSPAEESGQSQNRKRSPAWTDREVMDLIAVWGEESVLSELRSSKRNAKTFEKVSKAMKEKGYSRDAMQCRVKVKDLRQGYQKVRAANGRSGAQPQTCRFYEALHAILGGSATTVPPVTVDSEDGIVYRDSSSSMFADGEAEEGRPYAPSLGVKGEKKHTNGLLEKGMLVAVVLFY
ncbi:hypothetical protein KIL84_003303 [Mauremys mutica]|uniref:Myb/SANT-like DNA-binding domain-containing protein n=1 Tax=Mauremys mutica TaxID=74926 RepID=A0A9D4ATD7_9SAUR|nr:hypothetical protein KIL84_003303 [Mauremys mutica]